MAMVALNVLSLLFVHGALPRKSTVCHYMLDLQTFIFFLTQQGSVSVKKSAKRVVYFCA